MAGLLGYRDYRVHKLSHGCVTDTKATCWHRELPCHICFFSYLLLSSFPCKWSPLPIKSLKGTFYSVCLLCKNLIPLLFFLVFSVWREEDRKYGQKKYDACKSSIYLGLWKQHLRISITLKQSDFGFVFPFDSVFIMRFFIYKYRGKN